MKKIIVILSIAAIAAFLIGCRKDRYTDSLSCKEAVDAAIEHAPTALGYESFGKDHIDSYFEDSSLYKDYDLRYSVLSENINEVGIFHANNDKDADKLYNEAKSYIATLIEDKKAFIASYAPEELPKLERAEVKKFGNYVAYAILSDAERNAFFNAVENALAK